MRSFAKPLTLLGGLAAASVAFSSLAVAQPLTLRVSPTAPLSPAAPPGGIPALGYAVNPADLPPGVTTMGYTQDGWMMTPADDLHRIGPRYAQPSGVKLRRGSPVPDWIDTGDMQSVSIQGLSPGTQYGYFISPDQKIVVVDPQSRRVMRVIR
ncbi:DUF1236 domain-containing protein [Microvirga sp. Mcv34]|uniref:DUF1236 domain-containing protein n=1 Tax=Microvirga sp. Mcv34 TaxID=2926016 RepID=UPI0021C84E37|nr:DUF1236 domain-containing protein [Microvirga sp. Mcv34]